MNKRTLRIHLVDLAVNMGWLSDSLKNDLLTVQIPPIKMSHGPCCCCSTCGYYHDDCVCLTNEYLEKLDKIIDDIDYID